MHLTLPLGVLPQNWGRIKLNCSVTCMVVKATANDKRTSGLFRVPRFEYVGQLILQYDLVQNVREKQSFLEEKEFLGAPLTPPKRETHFPRLEEGNVPINTSWFGLFLEISRVLGESSTARGYPSADSSPIRKADCVWRPLITSDGGPPVPKACNRNFYICPVVVYKKRNFWERLSPHRKG
ncbi:hypothetical protein TNCV_123061 [Trichonephila clavipes]|nr:hypothetical protein TNCV_123061 [Trichonephila clavipes]